MPQPSAPNPIRAFLTLLIVLSACGDDAPPPGTFDTGPRVDTGVPGEDSGPDDDGGTDDAGAGEDAGTSDAGPQEVPCESEIFELITDPMARNRPVSVAATGRGFVFGWGDTVDVREQARTAEVAEGATMAVVRSLTSDDSSARAVSISEGYAIWLDDGGSGDNIVVRGIDTEPTEASLRTFSAATGQHSSPRLFKNGDGWVATWVRQTGEGEWQIESRAFDGDSESPIVTYGWTLPTSEVAVDFSDERFYFAWSSEGDVSLAVAGADGSVITDSTVINSQGNATSEVSVAFGDDYGIVSFGVLIEDIRREIRVRLMDADGAAVRPEQVVSRAPLRGRSPMAASYAGGYAIAYRASNPAGEDHLRVAFVHGSDGVVVAEYDLGVADFAGGQSGVAVDDDGGLAIGWANVEGAESPATVVRGARLSCGAAWLRCGAMP
ncbi:MAG: hypothetical protein AB8H86_16245 [Polyangiales bacterium]